MQPKVLAIRTGDIFTTPAEHDLETRYVLCEDLVQQLLAYSARKRAERPELSREYVLNKVAASARQKSRSWGLSPAETDWVLQRFMALGQT